MSYGGSVKCGTMRCTKSWYSFRIRPTQPISFSKWKWIWFSIAFTEWKKPEREEYSTRKKNAAQKRANEIGQIKRKKSELCLCDFACFGAGMLYVPLAIRASRCWHHAVEVVVAFRCYHYCCHCCYASISISVAMAVAIAVAAVGAVTHLPCKTFALVLVALMPLMNDLQMKWRVMDIYIYEQ